MIRLVALLAALATAAPAQQGPSLRDRIEALRPAPPAIGDVYAAERDADLDRLAQAAPDLFDTRHVVLGTGDAPPAIALFIGADCDACARARDELTRVVAQAGARATVIDADSETGAALMRDLQLDTLPSYAMADRLIRGHMPAPVLARYLAP